MDFGAAILKDLFLSYLSLSITLCGIAECLKAILQELACFKAFSHSRSYVCSLFCEFDLNSYFRLRINCVGILDVLTNDTNSSANITVPHHQVNLSIKSYVMHI